MKEYIIDTNCLLSYVTDRNNNQRLSIEKYFDLAFRYEIELIVIGNVVTEFVHVLTNIYSLEVSEVNTIITDLIQTPGIKFVEGYFPEKVLKFWPVSIKNFGDAVVGAYVAMVHLEVITFDSTFSKELKKINVKVTIPN